MKKTFVWAFAAFVTAGLWPGNPAWAQPQAKSKPTAIVGATLMTGVLGEAPFVGTVTLDKSGRIQSVVKGRRPLRGGHNVDAKGLVLTPGLFDAFNALGLVEVGADAAQRDTSETSKANHANLSVVDALKADSRTYRVARRGGVTRALSAPAHRAVVSGQSAVIHLGEGGASAITVLAPAALHVTLGETPKRIFGAKNTAPQTRMGTAALLREFFEDGRNRLVELRDHDRAMAKHANKVEAAKEKKDPAELEKALLEAGQAPAAPKKAPKRDAIARVLLGQMPVVMKAHRRDDILTALRLADEFGFRLIVLGGADAWMEAGRLAKDKVPVILAPLRQKRSRDETRRATLKNAALLHKAGVPVAIGTGDPHGAANLALEAGWARAHGLPSDAALAAITSTPAALFGLKDKVGVLKVGAQADLVLWSSDPLEIHARVRQVWINGRVVEKRPDLLDPNEVIPQSTLKRLKINR
jgi:imidazolonepropionase-like amidohydrolase